MPQIIEFEGARHEFPDDFTSDEISAALGSGSDPVAAAPDPNIDNPPSPPLAGAGPGGRDLNYYEPGYNEAQAPGPRTVGPSRKTFGPGVSISPRELAIGVQGSGRGMADLAGAPGDIGTFLSNLTLEGVDAIPGVEAPFRFPPSPIGGDAIAGDASRVAGAMGFDPVDPEDMSLKEKFIYHGNRFGSEAIGTGSALARAALQRFAAGTPTPKPRIPDAALRPYADDAGKALRTDAAAGVGSGAGLTAGQEWLPESVQGPVTGVISMLVGGAGGATAATAGRAPAKAVNAFRQSRPDPDTVDPVTKIPVSRRVADKAAKYVQGITSDDPANVARTVKGVSDDAIRRGEPVPSAGIASGDIGFTAGEKAARTRDSVPFQERDQQLRDAAQDKVEGLRDPDADPRAPQRLVEADRDTRIGAAEKQIENTQTNLDAAVESEKALGGEVGARRGGEVAASERIAETVGQTKRVDEARKSGLYGEAERLGSDVEIDPAPFAETARRVRDEIGPLAGQDASLNNILNDLDSLAPVEGEAGRLVVTDLVEMLPRLSQARDAARRLKRGHVIERLDTITSSVKAHIGSMADRGNEAAIKWREAESNFREDFAPKYREGVGGQLDRAERSKTPVEPSRVGGRFLHGGKEAAEDYRRILSGSDAETLPDKTSPPKERVSETKAVNGTTNDQAPPASDDMIRARVRQDDKIRDAADIEHERSTEILTRKLKEQGEKSTAVKGTAESQRLAREYVLSDMARVVGSDGKINVHKLRNWIANREGMFQVNPELREEVTGMLRDAVNRSNTASKLEKDLKEAVKGMKRTEDDIRKSATSLLLDSDPEVAAKSVFSHRDPEKAMGEIVAKLGDDKEAVAGWKRAVTEHLIDRVTNTNTAISGGSDGPVSIVKLKNFFGKNQKVLQAVYSPAEMHALKRAHRIIEPLGNLQRQGTPGSPTAENNEQAWRVLEAGLKATYGVLKGGGILRTTKIASRTLFRGDTPDIVALVDRMYLDPELAAHLLTRKPKDVLTPAWNAKLNRLLAYGQAARESAQEDEE